MKASSIFIFIILLNLSLKGQNFFIRVYDNNSLQGIADVRVILTSGENKIVLFTGVRGFASSYIPLGMYKMVLEKRGYETMVENGVIIQGHEAFNSEYRLKQTGIVQNQTGTLRHENQTIKDRSERINEIDRKPEFDKSVKKSDERVPAHTDKFIETDRFSSTDYLGITSRLYRRPSITYLYIDHEGDLTKEMINLIKSKEISEKFNDNRVVNCVIKQSGDVDENYLKRYIEDNVVRNIARIWFPFDNRKREHSLHIVEQRGLYDATDADVLASLATVRGEGILKDAGELLINKSYIVVYDVVNVKKVSSRDLRGYEAKLNIHLYKLNWTPLIMNYLLERWTNSDAIEQLNFSVNHVKSFHRKTSFLSLTSVQSTKVRYGRKSDEELFNELAHNIINEVEFHISKHSPDFQVKTSIAGSNPIKAPIGLKEGVFVDQRYFIYELSEANDGSIRKNRKSVVRATRRIADNRAMATGYAKHTNFYRVYGRIPSEGMVLEEKPDRGMSLAFSYWPGEYNVLYEGLVGALTKSTSTPEKSKVYLKVIGLTDYSKVSIVAVGISKDLYLGTLMSVNPYIGNSGISIDGSTSYLGLDAGINLNLIVFNNIHLTANAGFNSWRSIVSAEWIGYSGGLKILF